MRGIVYFGGLLFFSFLVLFPTWQLGDQALYLSVFHERLLVTMLVPSVLLWGFLDSVHRLVGRKPKWDSQKWKTKTELVFRNLKTGQKQVAPSDQAEEMGLSGFLLFLLARPIEVLLFSQYTRAIYHGGNPSRSIFVTEDLSDSSKSAKPYEVDFEARFYPDRITMGSKKRVFVSSYSEVFDIVQDKKYPGIAIIRNKKAEELVIKTDAFDVGEWRTIRWFIQSGINSNWKDKSLKLEDFLQKDPNTVPEATMFSMP